MKTELRKTGISIISYTPWGTHLCHFYETRDDLLDILIPYFKTGLENNEFCMWIVFDPLTAEQARDALKTVMPDAERHLAAEDIEIIPYRQWYLIENTFDPDRAIKGWKERLERAIDRGYAGMRVNGSEAWLTEKNWTDFASYEKALNDLISNLRMIVLCTYPLAMTRASELFDVARTHQFAIVRRQGNWEMLENPESIQARAEIKRQNEELEQRVADRSNELTSINEKLRQEISERTISEKTLQESEERFRRYFDLGLIGMAITSPTKGFIEVNDHICKILGYDRNELMHLTWSALTYPDDLTTEIAYFNRVLAGDIDAYEIDKRFIRKDGQIIYATISVKCVRRSDGSVDYFLALLQDITERKLSEDALRRSELLLRESQRIGKLGGWEYDVVTGGGALTNEIYNIYGKYISTPTEGLACYHKDDRPVIAEAFEKAKVQGIPYDLELRIINARGEGLWVRTIGNPISEDGKVVKIFGILQDITERKKIEEKLRDYAHRLVEIQENERRVISRRLHDSIGNTLAAVNMDLSIVQSEHNWSSFPEVGERLTDAIQKVTQVIALTRDIMTELRPPMLDEYGLASALAWLAGEFSRRTGIRVDVDANTYRNRLQVTQEIAIFRIVQEALTNITKHAHATSAKITLERDAFQTRLTICDDGKGFDATQTQARAHGSGLGLAVMNERAAAIKGTLKIDSRPGEGTTVTITVREEEDVNNHLSG